MHFIIVRDFPETVTDELGIVSLGNKGALSYPTKELFLTHQMQPVSRHHRTR